MLRQIGTLIILGVVSTSIFADSPSECQDHFQYLASNIEDLTTLDGEMLALGAELQVDSAELSRVDKVINLIPDDEPEIKHDMNTRFNQAVAQYNAKVDMVNSIKREIDSGILEHQGVREAIMNSCDRWTMVVEPESMVVCFTDEVVNETDLGLALMCKYMSDGEIVTISQRQ